MKKIILLFVINCIPVLLFSLNTSSNNFLVEFKICKLNFMNDSNSQIENKTVEIKFNQLSNIITVFKSEKHTYGIQFEVFESKLNNETKYYLRTAYYYKDSEDWILIDEGVGPTPIYLNPGKPSIIVGNEDCN